MAIAFQNHIHNLRDRLQSSQAGVFFAWWISELKDLLPSRMKAEMQHAQRRVILRIAGEELNISLYESGAIQELDVISLAKDLQLEKQRLMDLLAEHDLLEVSRDILLPEPRILRKEITLPGAVESNLRQALSFEMDRQTPFRAQDVFFDYRVLNRDRENSTVKIELLLTLKQPLMREIQALESLGVSPTGVDVEINSLPAGNNLLPLELRHRVVNSKSRLNLILSLVAAVLMAFVMLQSLWLRGHQVDKLTVAINDVREEAMQVQEIRTRILEASEAAGFLIGRRTDSLPMVKVLTEVTRILPDDTFLDRLIISADSVQIQGKSQNAQRLIELINQSPMFLDASFRGPTRLDNQTQKEIFDVNAVLVKGKSE